MKTGRLSGLPNAYSGNVLNNIVLIVFLIVFNKSVYAQIDSCRLTGSWFEIQKKQARYRIPLQLELKSDSTARYINCYPEKSINLTWSFKTDSMLTLSDGSKYKVIQLSKRLMKLRSGLGAKRKVINLKQFAWKTN